MMTTHNPSARRPGALLKRAHQRRGFFPTDRQRELYRAVLGLPAVSDQPDASQASGLSLVGYGGAMGGGKTRALVELAIDAACLFPGNNILIARHNFTDLATTTMAEFFRYCPDSLVKRRAQSPTHSVQIAAPGQRRPSTIHFRHLSDWTGLGSQQFGAVFIDEAGQVEAEAAQMLVTRLRHPAQPQPWFVAASNPYPGWFERWFVKRELPEAALERAAVSLRFVPARIEDNPHLPDNYAETQRAILPPDWVDRFIDGRFDAFLGQIYPNFDPALHRWDGPLPAFSRFIGGLDFGAESHTGHFTAGIVAGLTNASAPCGRGVLIRLDEFEQRGPGVVQRVEQWMQRCRRRFGPVTWCADRSQSAWIGHLSGPGLPIRPSKGGPGSVHVGIARVQERLNPDNPRAFYLPSLTQFPLRMREYRWKHQDAVRPEPRGKDDDLLDADRYLHELAETVRPWPAPARIVSTQRGSIAPYPHEPPLPAGALIPMPSHRNPFNRPLTRRRYQ